MKWKLKSKPVPAPPELSNSFRQSKFSNRIPVFTLIEVLVAVTVCGAVFVVLLSGFGQNLQFTGQAEDYTTAIMLAKSKMTELEAQASMDTGTQRGDFGTKFDRFRWETEIEQDRDKPLYTVKLTVFFKRTVDERNIELKTVLYKEEEDQEKLN